MRTATLVALLLVPGALVAARWTAATDPPASPAAVLERLWAESAARALRSGDLPTWQPDVNLGIPLAAATYAGPWYPPHLVGALGGARLAALVLGAQLALGALGLFLFLRTQGCSFGARLVGSLAFAGSGFVALRLDRPGLLEAAVWLPWALWAAERAERGARGALVGVFTALAALAGAVALPVAGTLVVVLRALGRCRGRALARVLGFVALGWVGAALAWVPDLEAWRLDGAAARAGPPSSPAAASPEPTDDAAAPRAALATLFLPRLLAPLPGSAATGPLAWWLGAPAGVVDLDGAADSAYLGIAVLLLATAAAVATPRKAAFPLVLLLATGALAWRAPPPLPGDGLGLARDATGIAWPLAAWLAALGADALAERRRGAGLALGWTVVLVAGLALPLALVVDPSELAPRLEARSAERHGAVFEEARRAWPEGAAVRATERLVDDGRWLLGLALLAGLGALVAGIVRRRAEPRAAPFLVALPWFVAIPLDAARLAFAESARGPTPPAELADALRTAARNGRVIRLGDPARLALVAPPGALARAGISELGVPTERPSGSLARLFGPVPGVWHGRAFLALAGVEALGHPALGVARVGAVLSDRRLEHPSLELALALPGAFAYRYRAGAGPEGEPRADGEQPCRTQVFATRDALEADAPRRGATPDWQPGEQTLYRHTPDRLDVVVRGTGGGWLVLFEAWYPGWKATVDGRDALLERALSAVRALPIPAGDVMVRTKFEPASLRVGASLSALAWLVLGVFLFRARG